MRRENGITHLELMAGLVLFSATLGVFLQLVMQGVRTARYSTDHLVASSIADRYIAWSREQVRLHPDRTPEPTALQDARLASLRDGRIMIRSTDWPRPVDANASHSGWRRLVVEVSFAHGRRCPRVSLSTLVWCGADRAASVHGQGSPEEPVR